MELNTADLLKLLENAVRTYYRSVVFYSIERAAGDYPLRTIATCDLFS